jgi:transposase
MQKEGTLTAGSKVNDGRTLTHEQSEYIRKQAVKAVRIDNRSPEEVIKVFGLHRSCIYRWLNKYDAGGLISLDSTKAKGPQTRITEKQKQQLARFLLKNPTQLSFEYALWTIAMIVELIERKFSITYSYVQVSHILKSIGFSKQRPLHRAYQQDPQQVEQWLKKQYPAIKSEAKKQKREIFFGDEAGFHATAQYGGTWAPKGETPIIKTTGQRIKVNCISAVNNNGSLRFMLYDGNFNSERFIEFLKRLLHKQTKPVTLIVDGHSTHKTKKVVAFVQATKRKLKLYYLPPYSPELNPDELVWNNAKQKVAKRKYQTDEKNTTFKEKVKATMTEIQKNKKILKAFYCESNVAYAI